MNKLLNTEFVPELDRKLGISACTRTLFALQRARTRGDGPRYVNFNHHVSLSCTVSIQHTPHIFFRISEQNTSSPTPAHSTQSNPNHLYFPLHKQPAQSPARLIAVDSPPATLVTTPAPRPRSSLAAPGSTALLPPRPLAITITPPVAAFPLFPAPPARVPSGVGVGITISAVAPVMAVTAVVAAAALASTAPFTPPTTVPVILPPSTVGAPEIVGTPASCSAAPVAAIFMVAPPASAFFASPLGILVTATAAAAAAGVPGLITAVPPALTAGVPTVIPASVVLAAVFPPAAPLAPTPAPARGCGVRLPPVPPSAPVARGFVVVPPTFLATPACGRGDRDGSRERSPAGGVSPLASAGLATVRGFAVAVGVLGGLGLVLPRFASLTAGQLLPALSPALVLGPERWSATVVPHATAVDGGRGERGSSGALSASHRQAAANKRGLRETMRNPRGGLRNGILSTAKSSPVRGRKRAFDDSKGTNAAFKGTRLFRVLPPAKETTFGDVPSCAYHSLATDWLKSTRMRRSSMSTLFIFLNACVALRRRARRVGNRKRRMLNDCGVFRHNSSQTEHVLQHKKAQGSQTHEGHTVTGLFSHLLE